MALPTFSMRQLIEAGVHFGHNTRRWNPKMSSYLFGVRNGIHIIDLQQTVPLMHRGMQAVREVVAGGGRVLFVGTKRAAADIVADSAKRCGQYYVNHRWLGGMLTNWKTISQSIKRLREIEEQTASGNVQGLTKKEQLNLAREQEKLERALGGIKEMGRSAGHSLHHRHQQGSLGGAGSQQAGHSGGGDPRFQLRSGPASPIRFRQ